MPHSTQKIPIITLTANLVAETTYYVEKWGAGETSRAKEERFQVGGKGINVSKMLLRLSANTLAICFPGGSFGYSCRTWLDESGIPYKAFTTDCVTRSGSIIRAPEEKEISILGLDSRISAQSANECVDFLANQSAPFVLAVCGVFPAWESDVWEPLRTWLSRRKHHVSLAVDTYGPALKWFVQQSPDLVKINRDELALLFDSDVNATPTDQLLDQIHRQFDCHQWIITNGKEKIWSKSGNNPCFSLQPRKAQSISPVGCGDVFFATLLDRIYNQAETELAPTLKLAAEYASRNSESHGIADFEIGANDVLH